MSRITEQEHQARFWELVSVVKRSGFDKFIEWLKKTDFFKAPASSNHHGDYPGGLLEHSLNVYDEFKRLCAAYPEFPVSEETAVIITLFHDLCKVNFYVTEKRNRKNAADDWEQYDFYTIKEKFCYGGHGSKSVFLLQNFIQLTPEEAVAINCHMGAWDGNNDVGNAYEQFPIAFLLHVADEAATFITESKGVRQSG